MTNHDVAFNKWHMTSHVKYVFNMAIRSAIDEAAKTLNDSLQSRLKLFLTLLDIELTGTEQQVEQKTPNF